MRSAEHFTKWTYRWRIASDFIAAASISVEDAIETLGKGPDVMTLQLKKLYRRR